MQLTSGDGQPSTVQGQGPESVHSVDVIDVNVSANIEPVASLKLCEARLKLWEAGTPKRQPSEEPETVDRLLR
jgi:hypothetical protein